MEIDAHTITVRHDGARRTLVVQGRPYGVALKLTLPQLESLALYLAHEVGLFRDERIEAEGALPQTEVS